jgi:uncharacterized protein YbjT (DUF2867 family)
MADSGLDCVTGAFSFSGHAIAERLLSSGRQVRTLTGHPERADNDSAVEVMPLRFADFDKLVASLDGVTTLYNSYWVRFEHGGVRFADAVANSRTLFEAARQAGVSRIVHVSITNPSLDSPYPYFAGKAEVEQALSESGVPYTILRPAILFGPRGILLNNIAWLLRHLPAFAIGGRGDYRIRPIHVDDLAELAVSSASKQGSDIVDAVGPERPTFEEIVDMLTHAVGSRSLVVHLPGPLLPPLSAVLGLFLRDVLLTRDEYLTMAAGLADTSGPPTGATKLSEWVAANAQRLGRGYLNEVKIHF